MLFHLCLIIYWVLITQFILYMSAHDVCFVLGMCFFFFGAVIMPIMGILIGFLTGFVGSFDFGWRWWTIVSFIIGWFS